MPWQAAALMGGIIGYIGTGVALIFQGRGEATWANIGRTFVGGLIGASSAQGWRHSA